MAKKVGLFMMGAGLFCLCWLWVSCGRESGTASAPEAAPVGTSSPTVEDWNAIYKAAKTEGSVIIYSLSSRIFDVVQSFEKQYPGVKVEASDMTDVEQLEKVTREQAAGIHSVDVLFTAGETSLMHELLPAGAILNYVPQSLLGGIRTADIIPKDLREPLLTHSLESKVIFYNFETYKQAPVKTLWDLTLPEWKGRVQMKDPMQTEENLNFLQMVVEHSNDMAKVYQEEFGKPLVLSPGIENAGNEFIYRLIKNNLVLTSSDGDASKAVGTAGQKKPPLALCCASSKIRDNSKGQKLAIAWDVQPIAGMTKRNFLVMAKNAPHPNAAKLLIQWMVGNDQGGAGFVPYQVPGQWSARTDVKPKLDISLNDLMKKTWFIDTNYVYSKGQAVRDFWISLK
jgi:iron(III) transport system substrate-binding protein